MAMVFIIFFFLHCDFTLTSWDYFIATAVLYTLSWCYSQCRTYFEYGVHHKARLQPETEGTLKITIQTRMVSWTTGQHIYLRFLTGGVAHTLTAHPFTICSMPQSEMLEKTDNLVFYVQARAGITKSLMAQAMKNPGTAVPVLMDGPYGGIPTTHLESSDQFLVVGGGAGAGFTLAVIEYFLNHCHSSGRSDKRLIVIVATRDMKMRLWYMEALREISNRYSQAIETITKLSIEIHETGQDEYEKSTEHSQLDVEKNIGSTTTPVCDVTEGNGNQYDSSQEDQGVTNVFNVSFFKGRPNLPVAVKQFVSAEENLTYGLMVCGPSSMSHVVGEAAVTAQQQIIKGKVRAKGVWFHAESFS